MYVLVNHEGNADEDSLMVVGVYGSIGAAREAMEKDVDEYIDECGWCYDDVKVYKWQACAERGRGFSRWVIFDTNEHRRWISREWRHW